MANITYTRLRSGGWGLRGPAGSLVEGAVVGVTTKAGKPKTETVGKVFWTGEDRFNGGGRISLAEIAAKVPPSNGGGDRGTGRVCAACQRPGRLVCDMEDGLYKHYNCCDIPPS